MHSSKWKYVALGVVGGVSFVMACQLGPSPVDAQNNDGGTTGAGSLHRLAVRNAAGTLIGYVQDRDRVLVPAAGCLVDLSYGVSPSYRSAPGMFKSQDCTGPRYGSDPPTLCHYSDGKLQVAVQPMQWETFTGSYLAAADELPDGGVIPASCQKDKYVATGYLLKDVAPPPPLTAPLSLTME